MSFNRIFIFIVIVFIAGCKCDETNSCDGLSGEGQTLMPFKLVGLTFESSTTDSSLNIFSRSSRFQAASSDDCSSAGWGKCDCEECPDRDGRVHYAISPIFSSEVIDIDLKAGTTYRGRFYPNDTTIEELRTRNEEFYVTTINETSSSNASFQIDFLEFSYIFSAEKVGGEYSLDANAQNSDIELLPSFSTPDETYTNVLAVDGIISRFTEKSKYINKLYISRTDGVVAFRSKQGEMFHLKK